MSVSHSIKSAQFGREVSAIIYVHLYCAFTEEANRMSLVLDSPLSTENGRKFVSLVTIVCAHNRNQIGEFYRYGNFLLRCKRMLRVLLSPTKRETRAIIKTFWRISAFMTEIM